MGTTPGEQGIAAARQDAQRLGGSLWLVEQIAVDIDQHIINLTQDGKAVIHNMPTSHIVAMVHWCLLHAIAFDLTDLEDGRHLFTRRD